MRIIRPAEPLPPQSVEPEPAETGLLTVDLAALAGNWRLLAAQGGAAECAAVIKADGYGVGLEPAMRALLRAGCRTFFVANAVEGERARAVSETATIYVLDGLVPGLGARLVASRLRPTLSSLREVDEWAALSRAVGRRLEAALHFDTGMNRMGLAPHEAAEACAKARDFATTLVMSHFLCAQWAADARNARQIDAFEAIRARFPHVPASLANSSGLFLPQRPAFDLTRPGYALYGGNPTPGAPNPMRAVARLAARILATRDIEAGESVGYDATWIAPRRTRLATVGVGYADGLPVSASGAAGKPAGEAIVGGTRCPFVGRVSMDYVVLDVTDAPPEAARRGDWAALLGDEIGVDDLAARADTIGYEILTRLGARYARRYVGG